MEVEFICLTNNIVNNSKFLLGGIKPTNKTLYLVENFNPNMPICPVTIHVKVKEGMVIARADIPEPYINYFPAVGICYEHRHSTFRKTDGVQLIAHSNIMCVSLNPVQNKDPRIKSIANQIREQLKKKRR